MFGVDKIIIIFIFFLIVQIKIIIGNRMSIVEEIFGKELYDQWSFDSCYLPWMTPQMTWKTIFRMIHRMNSMFQVSLRPREKNVQSMDVHVLFPVSLFGIEPITLLDKYNSPSYHLNVVLNTKYQPHSTIVSKNINQFRVSQNIQSISQSMEQLINPSSELYKPHSHGKEIITWIVYDLDVIQRLSPNYNELRNILTEFPNYMNQVLLGLIQKSPSCICIKTKSSKFRQTIHQCITSWKKIYPELDWKETVISRVKNYNLQDTPRNTPQCNYYIFYIYSEMNSKMTCRLAD